MPNNSSYMDELNIYTDQKNANGRLNPGAPSINSSKISGINPSHQNHSSNNPSLNFILDNQSQNNIHGVPDGGKAQTNIISRQAHNIMIRQSDELPPTMYLGNE